MLMPFRRVEVLDLRSRMVTVPGQEILTADNVSVRASVLVGFRITDPRAAFETAQSLEASLYAQTQLALRAAVAALAVEDLVAQRESLSAQLLEQITPQAALLGIVLETVGVKDLTFPPPLRQALQQVVEARKAAQASLERARGEMATLRSLANASRMLENNPALTTLRALQSGADGRNTIVLGMNTGVIPLGTPRETDRTAGAPQGDEENPAT
jgi:regulator of protease activity HflC (stomatin/prohibitin superfamily)